MLQHVFATTATALMLCATPAALLAEDLLSAELRLGITRNLDDEFFFKRVEGSFATQFDSRFNAQVDLGMSKYEAVGSTSPFLGVHLTYAATDALDLGFFFVGEDRRGTSYTQSGFEAAYHADRFRVEGFIAHQQPTRAGVQGDMAGVDLEIDLDTFGKWTALAGGTVGEFGGVSTNNVYVGAGWNLRDDLRLETRLARHDSGDAMLTVAAQFDLGKGVTFNRRDYFASFPGE